MTFRCTSSAGLDQRITAHDIYAAVLSFLEKIDDTSLEYKIQGNRAIVQTRDPEIQIVIQPIPDEFTKPV